VIEVERPGSANQIGPEKTPGRRELPQLKLLGGSAARGAFEIRMRAIWAGDAAGEQARERDLSVRIVISPRPNVHFPHIASDEGESLGDEQLDRMAKKRALEILAFLDAASRWGEFRRRARS